VVIRGGGYWSLRGGDVGLWRGGESLDRPWLGLDVYIWTFVGSSVIIVARLVRVLVCGLRDDHGRVCSMADLTGKWGRCERAGD
jgi:hypothetical protein